MNNAQWVGAQGGQAGTMVLTEEEHAVLNSVDHYLAAGLELKQWWVHASATNSFAERFELGLSYNRPDTGYGFFDQTRCGEHCETTQAQDNANKHETGHWQPRAGRITRSLSF